MLDGVVESAPTIQTAIDGGTAQITGGTGGFTQADTDSLAQILNFGALPISLKQQTVENVSPTLGSDQLRGGLIAGGIGLGLVLVYSLLYYRGLGPGDDRLAAGLGRARRTPRSPSSAARSATGCRSPASPASSSRSASPRTRSSSTSNDYATRSARAVRCAAVPNGPGSGPGARSSRPTRCRCSPPAILYWLSVGNVRGFAFTLGLSTITDLFVVFFFTKPLISVLAKTKLYGGGGKFSGLGRQRRVLGDQRRCAVRPSRHPKEA